MTDLSLKELPMSCLRQGRQDENDWVISVTGITLHVPFKVYAFTASPIQHLYRNIYI